MGTRLGSFVALVVLALAAVVSATYDGPTWESPQLDRDRAVSESDEAPPEPRDGGSSEPERPDAGERQVDDSAPGSAPVTILVLLLIAACLVAIAIAAGLHLVLRRRRLAGDRAPRTGATPLPDPPAAGGDTVDLDEELQVALDELAEGEPRNAIVAIWRKLESLLHSEHFPQHPADTPAEYAERARASYGLERAPLDELAALYREARFSTHPLTEQHRERAHRCLTRLRADLKENAR